MTPYVRRRLKICHACKHHVSVHKYAPADEGRKPPKQCSIPGCTCKQFTQKERS